MEYTWTSMRGATYVTRAYIDREAAKVGMTGDELLRRTHGWLTLIDDETARQMADADPMRPYMQPKPNTP